MKISKAIKALQALHGEHGDIDVVLGAGGGHLHKVKGIYLRQAKQHTEYSLFRTDRLAKGGYGNTGAFIQPYQAEIEARPDIPVVLITTNEEA